MLGSAACMQNVHAAAKANPYRGFDDYSNFEFMHSEDIWLPLTPSYPTIQGRKFYISFTGSHILVVPANHHRCSSACRTIQPYIVKTSDVLFECANFLVDHVTFHPRSGTGLSFPGKQPTVIEYAMCSRDTQLFLTAVRFDFAGKYSLAAMHAEHWREATADLALARSAASDKAQAKKDLAAAEQQLSLALQLCSLENIADLLAKGHSALAAVERYVSVRKGLEVEEPAATTIIIEEVRFVHSSE